MKKIILLILAILTLNCAYATSNTEYRLNDMTSNIIGEGDQVGYKKETKKWSKELSDADLIFTKHWTTGSGGFSLYELENPPEPEVKPEQDVKQDPNAATMTPEEKIPREKEKPQYETDTNFEFLCHNRLIGCNIHKLQLYRLHFDGTQFIRQPISDEKIKAHFPGAEIIKVSQFKNNEITLYKPFFKKQTYILINDTDRLFYKYFFEDYVGENNFFRNIFEIRLPRTLIYSHFKSTDPATPPLIIHIKGTVFKHH